jgi:hypothetical protein
MHVRVPQANLDGAPPTHFSGRATRVHHGSRKGPRRAPAACVTPRESETTDETRPSSSSRAPDRPLYISPVVPAAMASGKNGAATPRSGRKGTGRPFRGVLFVPALSYHIVVRVTQRLID